MRDNRFFGRSHERAVQERLVTKRVALVVGRDGAAKCFVVSMRMLLASGKLFKLTRLFDQSTLLPIAGRLLGGSEFLSYKRT